MAPRLSFLLLFVPLAACASRPASDEGGVTTELSGTESDDPSSGSTGGTETETGTGTGTGTETETGEDTLGFVPDEEFPGLCSLSELSLCDEFLQDCPDGEKCVPYHVEGCEYPRCVPITGDKPPGAPCTADEMAGDDCDGDSWCYPGTLDLELPPVCISFCQGTPDDSFCDDPALTCVSDDLVYGGPLGCRPSCDPLMPEGCAPYERCTLGPGQSDFGCVLAGGAAEGEVCGSAQDCDAGLCVLAEHLLECAGAACCSRWCDLMAPDCPMGMECTPVEVDDPNSTVGVCLLP